LQGKNVDIKLSSFLKVVGLTNTTCKPSDFTNKLYKCNFTNLHMSTCRVMNAKGETKFTAAEMKYMRRVEEFSWIRYKEKRKYI
jgi:hypothetical protein